MNAAQRGMQRQVATDLSTIVPCSDFTGFSSDYFQHKVGLYFQPSYKHFNWMTVTCTTRQIVNDCSTSKVGLFSFSAKLSVTINVANVTY